MMAAPGLDEITTTTLRNRKMDFKKSEPKDALKVAQSGTPVPAKDFSPKAKEAKADEPSAKGSMTKANNLPMPTATVTPVSNEPKKYEGSYEDMRQDSTAARRKGISTSDYEGSAADRLADAAGERRMKTEDSSVSTTSHRPGTSASANAPKAAHGFGHPASARDGHLRHSGHGGAHRIGRKK